MAPLDLAIAAAFGQAALTFWAIVHLGRARLRAIVAGPIPLADIARTTEAYPEAVRRLEANLRNQFETPVLFFAALALAAALGTGGWIFAAAAWGYLASRVVHRIVHVGTNDVRRRFQAFSAGLVALLVMWIVLGIELLL
ncbi:MAG: MAPEG family protein [Pseudomonadota bacterium]